MSDHLLKVDKSVDRHGWVLYRGRCTCSWAGPWQSSKGHAMRQFEHHLRAPPGPTDEEVRADYRRRIKKVHPDHGGSTQEAQEVIAAYEAFREPNA